MNRTNINELNLNNYFEAGFDKITIINQNNFLLEKQKYKNAEMYTYNEKGLSKSRNRGLELVEEEVFLLGDDDVLFHKNISRTILEKHRKYPLDKIITFKIHDSEGKIFNKYSKKYKKHNFRSILRVSSIEITFKKINFLEKYDEDFGLGGKYPTGEETIFLIKNLKLGIRMSFYPEFIGIHPIESSGSFLDKENIKNKLYVYKVIFGKLYFIFLLIFIIKKRKLLQNIGLLEAIKTYLSVGEKNE